MRTLTVTEASSRLGRSVKTLQRWDRDGILVAGRTGTNRRYYTEQQLSLFLRQPNPSSERITVAYCRVSSQAQQPDLKNQRRIIEEFCVSRGLGNVEYVCEVGGGLNMRRKLFCQLVADVMAGRVGTVVAAHKDRLARFGFELFKHICELSNCEVILLNNESLSPEQEAVQDLMTIVHCFSSRLYGLRNYKKDLKKALTK